MESLTRSLNFELPQDIHFDKYAQQILENSKTPTATSSFVSSAVAPTITTLNATTSSEFLQKIGATLLNSVQLQRFLKINNTASAGADSNRIVMEPEFAPNHVVIDSSSFNVMDEFQKQLEYDKFMNEVWIGIVMTLILISMLFCVCSCFLYHQFRTWKRNYRTTVAAQAYSPDNEALKLHSDIEDPVPEYTLVSGLPSYEAALELLHKTPKSCIIVYPNAFEIINKNEKSNSKTIAAEQQQQQQAASLSEVTTPLLATTSTTPSAISTTTTTAFKTYPPIPTYAEAIGMSNVTLTCINEKPSMHVIRSPTIAPTTTTAATPIASTTETPNITDYTKFPSYEENLKSLEKH